MSARYKQVQSICPDELSWGWVICICSAYYLYCNVFQSHYVWFKEHVHTNPPPPQHFSLRISAGGWGSLGRGAPAFTHWYFSFRALIKSSYLKMQKMYCQQIFPFEQLPYRFLSLFNFDLKLVRSSMQSTFSKHSSKLSLPSAILNLCDEYLTSLWLTCV